MLQNTFKILVFFVLLNLSLFGQSTGQKSTQDNGKTAEIISPSLIILGTIQDAGSPHIACTKTCCSELFKHLDPDRRVVSLGIVDPQNQKNFLFEATPDFPLQLKKLKEFSAFSDKETPDGIFLTHAHIGHYTGLMYLGREAMGAKNIRVYTMPRMQKFLSENGPWSQLVHLKNISIQSLENKKAVKLTSNITVQPFLVPHRDEYSETVGYKIYGPNKKVLFIPDIDKWAKWPENIKDHILDVDYAFLDASFYDGEELNHRDISEIPHPFIIESMEQFKDLAPVEKSKIYFIHFNHTNPVLKDNSIQSQTVINNGFNIAKVHRVFDL